MIIWIFGQPGSGKTTLAKKLKEQYPSFVHIDGDDIRKRTKNERYSLRGRIENHIQAIDCCKEAIKNECSCIVSMVTPYNVIRKMIAEELSETDIFFFFLFYEPAEQRGRESFHVKDFEFPNAGGIMPIKKNSKFHITFINTSVFSEKESLFTITNNLNKAYK